MARYLIIANQTAETHELRAEIRALAQSEPEAEFTLVVPATPVTSLLVPEAGDTGEVSRRHAASAQKRLTADGVRVADVVVGDADPFTAAADALGRQPGYTGILVATLPWGISHWLEPGPGDVDLIARLRELAPGVTVTHVVAESAVPALE